MAVEGGGLRWVSRYLKTSASMPLFLEFGIKSREDFEKIKKRFDPEDILRIGAMSFSIIIEMSTGLLA
ncbi:MAG: hypothetical protein ACUVTL_06685 [Thermoproteota archaeon]